MKKITTCLLLLATMLTLFSSCGNKDGTIGEDRLPFTDIYASDYNTSASECYQNVSDFSFPEGAERITQTGALVQYTLDGKYCFYNVDLDRVVLEIDASSIPSEENIMGSENVLKVVRFTENGEETFVYSNSGNLLAQSHGKKAVAFHKNGFMLNETFYYVKNGECTNTYKFPPVVYSLDYYYFTENYLIQRSDNHTAVFYDKNANEVFSYRLPGYARNTSTFVIGDKMLIQYSVLRDVDEDCDYTDGAARYTIHHLLLNPDKQKAEELDLGIVINQVSTPNDRDDRYEYYTDAVENVLNYYTIREKCIDRTTLHGVLMDNEGKIGASLDGYAEGQNALVSPLNKDYYYVRTATGAAVLDKEGNTVKKLAAYLLPKDYGFTTDKLIYNTAGELVLNLDHPSIYVYSFSSFACFYRESGTLYRYDKNGIHEITPLQETNSYVYFNLQNGFYFLYHSMPNSQWDRNEIYTYTGTYVGASMTLNYSNDEAFTVVQEGDDAILIRYTDADSNEVVYKRITK